MSRHSAAENSAQSGFSLIEVLAALVIASMALVVLMRGLGSSQMSAVFLESQLGARVLAQSIIEDERQAADTKAGQRSGTSGQYEWQFAIEPTAVDGIGRIEGGFRLYRLTVKVNWQPRGQLVLETLKLGK
jgi:prepilin-type N-terminal cleavage/methylation domain-containing protein